MRSQFRGNSDPDKAASSVNSGRVLCPLHPARLPSPCRPMAFPAVPPLTRVHLSLGWMASGSSQVLRLRCWLSVPVFRYLACCAVPTAFPVQLHQACAVTCSSSFRCSHCCPGSAENWAVWPSSYWRSKSARLGYGPNTGSQTMVPEAQGLPEPRPQLCEDLRWLRHSPSCH